jgi:hypothetical protein
MQTHFRVPLLIAAVSLFQSILFQSVFAQNGTETPLEIANTIRTKRTGVYKLGAVEVKIPSPDGFTDIFDRFDRVRDRLLASQTKLNLFAIHVPEGLIPELVMQQDRSLGFFTNVCVSPRLRLLNVSQQDYKAVVANLKKNGDQLFSEKNPEMISAVKRSSAALSQYLNSDAGFEISNMTNLGYIVDTKNAFSSMLLIDISVRQHELSLIASASLIYVKKKVIFVYVYKVLGSENDAATVRTITKDWLTRIVDANKTISK